MFRMPSCHICFNDYTVASLAGHLQKMHYYKNIQERKIFLNLCNKRTNIRRSPCPFPGCGKVGRLLVRHIQRIHNVSDDELESLKEQARHQEAERLLRALRDTDPEVPLMTTWDDVCTIYLVICWASLSLFISSSSSTSFSLRFPSLSSAPIVCADHVSSLLHSEW